MFNAVYLTFSLFTLILIITLNSNYYTECKTYLRNGQLVNLSSCFYYDYDDDLTYGFCIDKNQCCTAFDLHETGNCSHDDVCCKSYFLCNECPDGHRLVNNTCVEIDECEETYGLCSGHRCINTNGSYTCECYDSFHMIGKTKTCEHVNQTDKADLIFSSSRTLNLVSIKDKKLQIIYSGLHSPKSIDYSYAGNYIAWIDGDSRHITIAPLNYENPSQLSDLITLKNTKNPISLTVDWIYNLVYWIDSDLLTINVISLLKPNDYYVLVNISDQNPKQIVVNVFDSVLYWNHIGVKSKIMRSSQDGSNQTMLYSSFKQVFCFTTDIYLKRIYFVDIETSYLYSIDLNGKDERRLINSKTMFHSAVNSINVFYDEIYFSNNELIFSINKFGLSYYFKKRVKTGESEESFYGYDAIITDRDQIFTSKVIHPSLQPSILNRCENAKCSDLCLPINDESIAFRCICPQNHVLLIGGRICVKRKLQPIADASLSLQNDLKSLVNISDTSKIMYYINQSINGLLNNSSKQSNSINSLVDINLNLIREIRKSSIQSLNESLMLKNSVISSPFVAMSSTNINLLISIKHTLIFISICISLFIIIVLVINVLKYEVFKFRKPHFKLQTNANAEENSLLCESESKV